MSDEPETTYRPGDALVARVAAEAAAGVPGVVALRTDLAGTLLGLAGQVLGTTRAPVVGARVDGRQAEVTLSVVTRLGFNCRDLARAVQREVAEAVRAYTGLDTLVRVTVVEVLIDRSPTTPADAGVSAR
ncbi:MAG: Asp23/Gls24 family envelope stress response protein [Candidatus Nanopelagicales bacterium]|uniref:Asp23/Gls24 family envelope stress response protein n=1 Tax=Pseudonocardia sp. TaxID=60912 RepID=UPI000FB677DA|nr:MAG: Asp23/Gls24 family envelope stress response protein [Pseudonocardiaceae bacterium]